MSGGNSVYSPLPQSNTDTDESSEEELHSSHESHVINRRSLSSDKLSNMNGQSTFINYKPIDNDREVNITLNGFDTNVGDTNVFVKNTQSFIPNNLSLGRLLCLVFSILLCVVIVTIFLLLPCDVGTCPSKLPILPSSTWERSLLDIEIKGPIDIVPAVSGKTKNIVILARGSIDKNYADSRKKGVVLSLIGSSGEVAWYSELVKEPRDIDCSLIDVDSDNVKDCILVGGEGLLRIIEPLSGTVLWTVSKNIQLEELDFPLVIPDLDGDNVPELLLSCQLKKRFKHKHNTLLIVSGRTGVVYGQPLEILCDSVHNLVLEKELILSYTCFDPNKKESTQTMTFNELHTKIVNQSRFSQIIKTKPLKQHVNRPVSISETSRLILDNKRLVVENYGVCPHEDCHVVMSVRDERDGLNNYTLWSFKKDNTYAMLPISFSFDKHVSGFVVKMWEWVIDRDTRSVDVSFFTRPVKESVVLILFNTSNSALVNKPPSVFKISQLEITLLCAGVDNCQPNMTYQRDSLFITDLNEDNLQELISHTSTYTLNDTSNFNNGNPVWQLKSSVRMVHLETELTKFYQANPTTTVNAV